MLKNLSRTDVFLILAFLISAIIATVWAYIDVLRFEAYNASIYDLGLSFEDLYGVTHGGLIASSANPRPIFLNKLIYLPLGLIFYLDPSFSFMLVIQAAYLSLGSTVVYLIARRVTGSGITAFAFSLCYALYYPLSGVYWFDFHFMAFFPTSFLLGFYFYLRGNNAVSVAFFTAAAITDYISPVIILFTAAYLFYRSSSSGPEGRKYALPAALAIISLALIASIYLYFGPQYTLVYAHANDINGFTQQGAGLLQKAYFIPYILISLAFLPLAFPELLLPASPFIALALYNNYVPYLDTTGFQYPALFSAQLFLAAIFGYKGISSSTKVRRISKPLLATLAVLTIVLFAFANPLGNIVTGQNQYNPVSTELAGIHDRNSFSSEIRYTASDQALSELLALVPHGSSVMVQNNMPEMVYKYNWSLPFQREIPGTYPEYIVTDPYSSSFTGLLPERSNNYTMENAFNFYFGTGKYGVLGDAYGEILLEKGYTGSPLIYDPVNKTILPGELHLPPTTNVQNGVYYIGPVTNGSYGWYGPYITMAPGTYSAIFRLSTDTVPQEGNFSLQVAYTPGPGDSQTLLSSVEVSAAVLLQNSSENFVLNFTLTHYTGLLEFRCLHMHYASEIGLSSITVMQTGAASP